MDPRVRYIVLLVMVAILGASCSGASQDSVSPGTLGVTDEITTSEASRSTTVAALATTSVVRGSTEVSLGNLRDQNVLNGPVTDGFSYVYTAGMSSTEGVMTFGAGDSERSFRYAESTVHDPKNPEPRLVVKADSGLYVRAAGYDSWLGPDLAWFQQTTVNTAAAMALMKPGDAPLFPEWVEAFVENPVTTVTEETLEGQPVVVTTVSSDAGPIQWPLTRTVRAVDGMILRFEWLNADPSRIERWDVRPIQTPGITAPADSVAGHIANDDFSDQMVEARFTIDIAYADGASVSAVGEYREHKDYGPLSVLDATMTVTHVDGTETSARKTGDSLWVNDGSRWTYATRADPTWLRTLEAAGMSVVSYDDSVKFFVAKIRVPSDLPRALTTEMRKGRRVHLLTHQLNPYGAGRHTSTDFDASLSDVNSGDENFWSEVVTTVDADTGQVLGWTVTRPDGATYTLSLTEADDIDIQIP